MQFKVIDNREASSKLTDPIIIVVKYSLSEVGNNVINFLTVTVPLTALIIVLILILFYGWRKFSVMKKKLIKEVYQNGESFREDFAHLCRDLETHIKWLEKAKAQRTLTKEEEEMLEGLKKNMSDAKK